MSGAPIDTGEPDAPAAAEVAAVLGLAPHREGGFFRETYRSPVTLSTPAGPRSLVTAILYLLTAESPSRFHRLRFDEVWFYHTGAQIEMFLLGGGQADAAERVVVGPDRPQTVVPGGRWMAARVTPAPAAQSRQAPNRTASAPFPPAWALVGCVVSPGFEYEDFELGGREALSAAFPRAAAVIRSLT